MKPIVIMARILYRTSIGRNFSSCSKVKIEATPRVALSDVLPVIKVQGLQPITQYTLQSHMFDDKGKKLLSNGHYISDESGCLDMTKNKSLGGAFTGVFPSGLISTLKIADGNSEYGRLKKDTVTEPMKIHIDVFEGHQPLNITEGVLDSITLERHFMGPGVKRIPLKEGRIRGALFLPPIETAPFPVVIDMFGALSDALLETRSALTASRGIASLSLRYFGYEDIPNSKIMNLDLEYFEEAIDFALSQDGVIKEGCGILANCLGGTIGNFLSCRNDKVKALYAINYSNTYFNQFTHNGKLIYPTVGGFFPKNGWSLDKDGLIQLSEDILKYFNSHDKDYITDFRKVYKKKPIKYVIGADDPYRFVDGIDNLRKIIPDLDDHVDIQIYPKCGHLVDAPYSMLINKSFIKFIVQNDNKELEMVRGIMEWFGESHSMVKMQEEVWKDALTFFKRHLLPPKSSL